MNIVFTPRAWYECLIGEGESRELVIVQCATHYE